MNRFFIILFSCFLLLAKTKAQTQHTIDSLAKVEQACLDKGSAMATCVSDFYDEMDSLLNIVYKKLYLLSNEKEQKILKANELQWLKERDIYFKKVAIKNKKLADKDETLRHFNTMLNLKDEADFVKQRVEFLLKKLNAHL